MGLWNRQGREFDNSWCKIVGDQDYTVDIDTDETEEEIFEVAATMFYNDLEELTNSIQDCDDFKSAIELVERFKANTKDIADEAGEDIGNVTVFYDMNNDSIDYVVSDDATGYSYDTHTYQIALTMEDKEDVYVVCFADGQNDTRYVDKNESNKGTNSRSFAKEFVSEEDAIEYLDKNECIDCWVEDCDDETVYSQRI